MTTDTDPHASGVRLVDLQPADLERIRAIEDTVWFEVAPGLTAADYVDQIEWGRIRGYEVTGPPPVGVSADAPAPLAAIYGDYTMAVTVPGPLGSLARVPMGGLTWVGVHPDHRRRGLLTGMVRDHFDRLRGTEETISGLHASEPAIYGRFGYGLASLDVRLTFGRGTTFTVPPEIGAAADQVRTHVVPVTDPAVHEVLHRVHLATAEHTLGAVTRGDAVASDWFRDFPTVRGKKEPWQVLLAQRPGDDGDALVGYAVFRREAKWSDTDVPEGEVTVREMGAVDAPALLALGRRLVDFDLTAKVELASRSLDDPLYWWAGGPRQSTARVVDALWLRPVEVGRALEARGYAQPCSVVLDVVDEVCDWNAGTWRLHVGADGVAECARVQADADVRLPVTALGASYLGGRRLQSLAAAGRVVELRSGAVRELSRAMRADVDPSSAVGF